MIVLDKFRIWLDKKLPSLNTKTLLGTAVCYANNQWHKLIRYLDCAELTPDNNLTENAIRPFAVGRKNWLFYKCPKGASSGAIIYSLIETAKVNDVNPSKYLRYVLEKAPFVSSPSDWNDLLPWNVKSIL
jgi:transposase